MKLKELYVTKSENDKKEVVNQMSDPPELESFEKNKGTRESNEIGEEEKTIAIWKKVSIFLYHARIFSQKVLFDIIIGTLKILQLKAILWLNGL
jgi:hypothetical protein